MNVTRAAVLMAWVCLLLAGCKDAQQSGQQTQAIDSLINAAYKVRDYQTILSLTEHQHGEKQPELKACFWRGYAYSRLRKMRMAEMEWNNAIAASIDSDEDLEYYSKSANRLVGLLYLKGDYEKAIQVAAPAMKLLRKKNYTANTDYANLLTFIGSCQLKIGHQAEAAHNFNMVWQQFQQLIQKNDTITNYVSAIVGIVTIVDTYLQTGHYDEAYEWTKRQESMLRKYEEHPQVQEDFMDKGWARLNIYRSCALEGLGRKEEAAKAYDEALKTRYIQTGDGKIEATNYLIAAHRWKEAADCFKVLDAQWAKYDIELTIDNIQTYLLPKFRANAGANRADTAIAVGMRICNALDSAIVRQKMDEALELATIYETQKKDTEIIDQRASLSHLRFLTAITAFALVVMGFILFIFLRHRAAMRLETAYRHLETANTRAEESSRMKSDFIQQISHEIRTPLNILSGFTQILTTPDMTLDEETLADIKHQITENTDRITSLVNKMLELSDAKNQTVIERSDQVPAVQIAAEAVSTSGIEGSSHLTFDLKISPKAEDVMLQTNLRAAVRALSLLLDNARKFTAPAEARQHDTPLKVQQKVALRLSVARGMLFYAVEDNGIGIPHKEAERIFEEFVQLDEYYDGTGIGLTVARSLVRRIGGDIVVDTAYIGGARFVMTLPLTA